MFTIEELSDIKTSVSEVVTNCIIHAYDSSDEIIKVHCSIVDNMVIIEISDTGCGIEDVEQAKKPLFTSKGELDRSGMGFTIVENFMDEVKVESIVGIGTKVTMKKVIKKDDGLDEDT